MYIYTYIYSSIIKHFTHTPKEHFQKFLTAITIPKKPATKFIICSQFSIKFQNFYKCQLSTTTPSNIVCIHKSQNANASTIQNSQKLESLCVYSI